MLKLFCPLIKKECTKNCEHFECRGEDRDISDLFPWFEEKIKGYCVYGFCNYFNKRV